MTTVEKVTTTPVQFALRYAALGWAVFPCRENDKRPLIERGLNAATADAEVIRKLWRENPRANVGVPCGTHFWVLDIDPRHGGVEALAALEDRYGEIPETLSAKTPSGGVHYYFHPSPDARNSAGKVGPGIDVRGHGGYVCVEGSRVNGSGYAFQDWDPLSDSAPEVSMAPKWLTDLAFGRAARQGAPTAAGGTFSEGGRNQALTREAGKLRRIGMPSDVIEAALQRVNLDNCAPPLDADEVATIAKSVGRYAPGGAAGAPETVTTPRPALDWAALQGRDPPARRWATEAWLGFGHITLLVGQGGIGKTLCAQQWGSALAVGHSFIAHTPEPLRVLMWACEDDHDELWRRQVAIAQWLGKPLEAFSGFSLVPRLGAENTLMVMDFGRAVFTSALEDLRQQVNDEHAQVVILDNVAQLYGGNENDRGSVTRFMNGLAGALPGTATLLLGHPSRAAGSEWSGSSAWEAVARTRLYLGRNLPDQPEDANEDDTTRYLARRKANYSAMDYRRFEFNNGVLVQDVTEGAGGLIASLRKEKARRVVLDGLKALNDRDIHATDARNSPRHLPRLLIEFKLNEGMVSRYLVEAMRAAMMDGQIVRDVVGKYPNRTPIYGLKLCTK